MLTHPLNFRVVAKTSLELLYLPIYSLNILQLLNQYISQSNVKTLTEVACETHMKFKKPHNPKNLKHNRKKKEERQTNLGLKNREQRERRQNYVIKIKKNKKIKACFDSLSKIFWLMFGSITKTQLILATYQKHLFLISSLDSLLAFATLVI